MVEDGAESRRFNFSAGICPFRGVSDSNWVGWDARIFMTGATRSLASPLSVDEGVAPPVFVSSRTVNRLVSLVVAPAGGAESFVWMLSSPESEYCCSPPASAASPSVKEKER